MNGYKVVATIGNKYSSLFASRHSRVFYEIGTTTYPIKGNGPLAVFNTYENAVNFTIKHSLPLCEYFKIFRCEYEESDEDFLWESDGCGLKWYRENYLLPEGTILAKSVKLLEETVHDAETTDEGN